MLPFLSQRPNRIRFLLSIGGVLLAVCLWHELRAEGPQPSNQFILLRNGSVLEGVPSQTEGQVSIRFRDDSQTRVSVDKVLCWAPHRRDLYRYRVEHRIDANVATHLNDARWCLRENLLSLAQREFQEAQTLEPDNLEVIRFQKILNRAIEQSREPQKRRLDEQEKQIAKVSYRFTQPGRPNLQDNLDWDIKKISPQTLALYTRRIQPLLINGCGVSGCHQSGNSPTAWQLTRPMHSRRLSSRQTKQNLKRLAEWLDGEHIETSPLLVRAEDGHSRMRRRIPIKPFNKQQLNLLQQWTRRFVGEIKRGNAASTTASSRHMNRNRSIATEDVSEEGNASEEPPHTSVRQAVGDRPFRLPKVQDPFDADTFNRMRHR